MRRPRSITTLLSAAAILATAIAGTNTASGAPTQHEETATYILRLTDPPLAAYRGGIPGLPATSPAVRGQEGLRPDSPAATAYLSHLRARHREVETVAEQALGRELDRRHDYRYAFNGMALELTAEEAAAVRFLPGVAEVQRDFRRRVLTDAGPEWIGAPQVWDGSATGGLATKGEGVVVGVIDTGVNFDHPSFADVGGDRYDHDNPRDRFFGLCDPLTGAPFCNDKLIGVHDLTGTSPHDDNGHGSHTASTAAGNVLRATMHAPTMELSRDISGVAPHANVITYKACLAIGSCVGSSLVAAIDQATADGVDVINYSIGGEPNNPWRDADAQAFLGARDAGVFVATSAGNSGSGAGTVGSPADAPWVMSVGASTHNRSFVNTLSDLVGGASAPPADIDGRSLTSGYGPAPIVYAGDYGDALCGAPFPPGTFDGEIVICDRGVNPRVEKGRNVELGGAGGIVLANSEADGKSTVADAHELPAVHIGYTDGQALKTWVDEGGGPTATISGTVANEDDANGDVMAGFSSRGPNTSAPGVIKPDVTAPGVDVLAAVHTVDPTAPAEYGLLSGTSMSSPHAAGAAALVRAVHPDWTPAQVQSALTSTGDTTVRDDDGTSATDAFDIGGGRVDLTRAARAGLVLDETTAAYTAADPSAGGDPTGLNLATLGNGDCAGRCTWVRTVTNALDQTAVWQVATDAPPGLDLSVKPARLRLEPGESTQVTVTADVSGLTEDSWVFGSVTLSSRDAVDQRLPVAVLPGGAPQPVSVDATETSGTHSVEMSAPVDIRRFSSATYGLQQGILHDFDLAQDPTPLDPYDGTGGTDYYTMPVPAGSRLLDAEVTGTTASDLDLFVGRDNNEDGEPSADEEVCRSASEIAVGERCSVQDLQGGTYWVMVQNWLTGQALDEVTVANAVIPGTDNGNLTVTGPSSRVPAGQTFTVDLSWNEPSLHPDTVWYALVRTGSDADSVGNVGSLLVDISR